MGDQLTLINQKYEATLNCKVSVTLPGQMEAELRPGIITIRTNEETVHLGLTVTDEAPGGGLDLSLYLENQELKLFQCALKKAGAV